MDEKEKGKIFIQIKRVSEMTDQTFDALFDALGEDYNKEVTEVFIQLKKEVKRY